MKQILSFESFKKINEHVVFDYREYSNNDDLVNYKFIANGVKYDVRIWHDRKTHSFGVWEVEFGFSGQKHEGDRTHKDIKHLNSVLNTVCEISEKVVKSKKIHTLKLQAAGDEKDESGYAWDSNIRSKMYVRFLSNRYGSDKVEDFGRYITLDMTKVFPEIIDTTKKSKKDLVVDELLRMSDEDPDRESISRGVDGVDDNQFTVYTDSVLNSKVGVVNFEIDVWVAANEYSVGYEFYDREGEEDGGEKYENFDNFDSLLTYLKNLLT